MSFLIVLLAWTLAGAASVQNAEKHVFVTAMDKEGKPIVGLAARHFAVRESGRDRTPLGVEALRTRQSI